MGILKDDNYYKILNEYKRLKNEYPDCCDDYIITFIRDLFNENITYIRNIIRINK